MDSLKLILSAQVAFIALFADNSAFAQEVAVLNEKTEASNGFEEIVVTARRREESLQSIPASVTALNGELLNSSPITNAQSLTALAPSLNVSSGNARDVNRFAIRGQGVVVFGDPGVVSYFAEVPLASGGAGPGYYYDLSNIQVINGPQGTLFGRNTTGGAVLFQPAKPTDQYEGYLKGTIGSYSTRQLQGALNIPLIGDQLLLRIAGDRQVRNGFTHDVNTGRDYDDVNYWAGRISLIYKPTDRIENYLLFYFVNSHNNGTGTVVTDLNPTGSAARLFPTFPALVRAQQQRGVRNVALSSVPEYKVKSWAVTDILTWDIDDSVTVKNIAAYQRFRSLNLFDLDGTPLPIQQSEPTGRWNNVSQPMNIRSISDELQLSGKAMGGALTWLVGGYFQSDKPVRLDEWANRTLDTGVNLNVPQFSAAGQKLTTLAAYTQETLDIGQLVSQLDGLQFTAGYRFTRDAKTVYGGRSFPRSQTCSTPAYIYPNCTEEQSANFKASTYTLSLDYHISSSMMVYLTRRTGFKSGTFNLGLPANSIIPRAVNPEKITDHEAGFKADMWLYGVPVRFNLIGFHQKYSGIQRQQSFINPSDPTRLVTGLASAASAKIDGGDVQLSVKPINEIELTANYTYLDARYDRFTSPTAGVIDGQPLPFAPKHSLNMSGTVHLPARERFGQISVNARYAYQSKVRHSDDITPGVIVNGYGVLNISLDWKNLFGHQGFDLNLFMTNALDREYKVAVSPYYTSIGYVSAAYSEPRMIGASLRYSWGQ